MLIKAAQSSEFGPIQQIALATSGTVALPSPPPAVGKLFLVRNSDANPALSDYGLGTPRYILKLVQTVVEGLHEITRFLALEDLKAVNIPIPEANAADPKRQTFPVEGIADLIEKAVDGLEIAAKDGSGREWLLLEDVVIYVSDSAPVLVRTISHFGVTAAEAAENGAAPGEPDNGCCWRRGV